MGVLLRVYYTRPGCRGHIRLLAARSGFGSSRMLMGFEYRALLVWYDT